VANLYRGGEPTGPQIISLISRCEWEADANIIRWLRDEIHRLRQRIAVLDRDGGQMDEVHRANVERPSPGWKETPEK
jgi:hypothetical protein